jgi:hypothetical protein
MPDQSTAETIQDRQLERQPEKSFTVALVGFSAVVISGSFGRPVDQPAAVVSLVSFAVGIPLLSAYWLLAYSAPLKYHLDWIENVFAVGVLACLLGFCSALYSTNVIVLTVFVVAIIVAFMLVLAGAQGWGRPKPPPPGWKPTYTPRNDLPDD